MYCIALILYFDSAKIPACIKTRASDALTNRLNAARWSFPKGDVVVKNGKHSGMPSLLVRDEATGGLYGKTNPT
jgi:hypothetical protein